MVSGFRGLGFDGCGALKPKSLFLWVWELVVAWPKTLNLEAQES